MKKIPFLLWFLAPFKWLRKIRGFRLVYTPLIAIVIFTAVMGIILGTLQLQKKVNKRQPYLESSLLQNSVFNYGLLITPTH